MAIDVHNYYRQGGLALERHIKTHQWSFRLFTTVLGMIETDCYLAYSQFLPTVSARKEFKTHRNFTDQLAHSLMHNSYDREVSRSATKRRRSSQPQPEVHTVCSTAPTLLHPHYVKKRSRARAAGNNTRLRFRLRSGYAAPNAPSTV